jgi:hypothetical protein
MPPIPRRRKTMKTTDKHADLPCFRADVEAA